MKQGACAHAAAVKDPPPRTPEGCEECLRIGDEWVHLRLCEECGHVGCCDSSKARRLLRQLEEHARDQAFPRDEAPRRRVVPAGRELEVVLRARSHLGVR
jgi:hypothetical protein